MSFNKPPHPNIWKSHDSTTRLAVYESRVTGSLWLIAAAGATIAMVGTDTFADMARNLWDRMLPMLYLLTLAAIVVLSFSLVHYKHEVRKLTPATFDPQQWPTTAEAIYKLGLILAIATLAAVTGTLCAALASPPSHQSNIPTPHTCRPFWDYNEKEPSARTNEAMPYVC